MHHLVSGPISKEEAVAGAAEAVAIVASMFERGGPVRLLLDLRDAGFGDIAAHRAWSNGFIRNPAVLAQVERVALLGRDTPQVRAEQELLETARHRFFFDEESALAWLSAPGDEVE